MTPPIQPTARPSSPSFVWVKHPNRSMQHQAELLEVREEGYLVRWTLCNKEELISPDCILEQQLPSRRRSSSMHASNPQDERKDDGDEEQIDGNESSLKGSSNKSSVTQPSRTIAKDKHRKRPSSSTFPSNKENKSHSKHPKIQYAALSPTAATNHRAASTTSHVGRPPTATNQNQINGNNNQNKTPFVSLWRIHRIPKSTSEARVAQLLQPYGMDQASNVVSNLFLFAFERQSPLLMLLTTSRVIGKLQRAAHEDQLTGLLNRRGFYLAMAPLLAREDRHERAIDVLMLDIDHFKQVNDSFGHATGDLVLAEVGRVLRETVRGGDIAARWGGEEFCVLLSDSDLPGAQQIAERIRQRFTERCLQLRELGGQRITISVGIARGAPERVLFEQLLERADDALYQAKQNGRDRVCVASDT